MASTTETKGLGSEDNIPREKRPTGVTYIIAIGIDQYQQAELRLPNCVNDCRRLIETLNNGFVGFQVYAELYDEKATSAAISDAIYRFSQDKEKNTPLNNLLIYYSGHGGAYRNAAQVRGAWIPVDFAGDLRTQSIRLNIFIDELEPIQTQGLLVIADCCQAATLFEGPLPAYPPSAAQMENSDLYEFYRMGLAASGPREVAKAGEPGGNSVFTAALITLLEQNKAASLSISELVVALKRDFNGSTGQSVRYNMLNTTVGTDGDFTLNANVNEVNRRLRYDFLEKGFRLLNYVPQRNQFEALKTIKLPAHFTFFSGTKTCGINFLAFLARISGHIPSDHRWYKAEANTIRDPANRLLRLMASLLPGGRAFTTVQQVTDWFLIHLAVNSIVIEVRFYSDESLPEDTDITQQRKPWVEELAQFVASINGLQTLNKLYIFIVDSQNANYEALLPDRKAGPFEALILEKVKSLPRTDFETWYNNEQLRDAQFNVLLEPLVKARITDIFDKQDPQPPANVIRNVCKLASCDALAETLLNPTPS
jgi:hypothetical protein